jgi:hypothetical protein
MKDKGKKFIHVVLIIFLGCFILNSVGFADLIKPGTAQPFSINSFSKQQVIQPTISLVVTNPDSVPTRFRRVNLGSQSTPRNLGRYVQNTSQWYIDRFNAVIDQAIAENNAISSLKTAMGFNPENFNLTSVQLVNTGIWGKEYRFEWTLKPNVQQTKTTVTASVNAKTGEVISIGSWSVGPG